MKTGATKGRVQYRPSEEELQELRKTKVDEQKRVSCLEYRADKTWQPVLSRKEKMKEKQFLKRKERWQKSTSFFVSNLPNGCSGEMLWEAFQNFGSLDDVFIPKKKDGAGTRFGLIRFTRVENTKAWALELQGISIKGLVLAMSIAKFNRDGSKICPQSNSKSMSIFERLGRPEDNADVGNLGTNSIPATAGSFQVVLSGVQDDKSEVVLELPPSDCQCQELFGFLLPYQRS